MIGLNWIGLDWVGLDWTGLDWTGVDWTGRECIGLGWTALDRTRLLSSREVKLITVQVLIAILSCASHLSPLIRIVCCKDTSKQV